jgi:hypothetical protein
VEPDEEATGPSATPDLPCKGSARCGSRVPDLVALDALVTAGDATQTARDIVASLGLFRLGIVSLTLVTALDVVIACALYRVFSPVHKNLCTLRWPCDWSTRPSSWSQQVRLVHRSREPATP